MDADFWLQKWEKNDIGFHQSEANPFLVKYFNQLSLAPGGRVFLPLCGKTLDIAWLLSKQCQVVGIELIETAILQLFAELQIVPARSDLGALIHYSAENLDLFVGDIFDLSTAVLGPVDAVYDRAALVALPRSSRIRYTSQIRELSAQAPLLLLGYEYDQAQMEGPPFSVDGEQINEHYGDCYDVALLESIEVSGGCKGICAVKESVWLLRKN